MSTHLFGLLQYEVGNVFVLGLTTLLFLILFLNPGKCFQYSEEHTHKTIHNMHNLFYLMQDKIYEIIPSNIIMHCNCFPERNIEQVTDAVLDPYKVTKIFTLIHVFLAEYLP